MSEYVIAKYLRLSLEDADLDPAEKAESNSIFNQRRLIDDVISTKFAGKAVKVLEFADDGRSGTNFERPGVTKLLDLAKQGQINCIIVKDFSRWGRDYIAVSDYLEQIFPFCRYALFPSMTIMTARLCSMARPEWWMSVSKT